MRNCIKLLSLALLVGSAAQLVAMDDKEATFRHMLSSGVVPGMHPSEIYSRSKVIVEGTDQAKFSAFYKKAAEAAVAQETTHKDAELALASKAILGTATETELAGLETARTTIASKLKAAVESGQVDLSGSAAKKGASGVTAEKAAAVAFDNELYKSTFKIVTVPTNIPAGFGTAIASLLESDTPQEQFLLALAVSNVLAQAKSFVNVAADMESAEENFDTANATGANRVPASHAALFKAVLEAGEGFKQENRGKALAAAIAGTHEVLATHAGGVLPGYSAKRSLTAKEISALESKTLLSAIVAAFK